MGIFHGNYQCARRLAIKLTLSSAPGVWPFRPDSTSAGIVNSCSPGRPAPPPTEPTFGFLGRSLSQLRDARRAFSLPDHGEIPITQRSACGIVWNSPTAMRSDEDSPVGMQSRHPCRGATQRRAGHAISRICSRSHFVGHCIRAWERRRALATCGSARFRRLRERAFAPLLRYARAQG
jgi:hypothetical protein